MVPKIYGNPKVHKEGLPLRPIVSSMGSLTYVAARVLADVLTPLMGKTQHHIKNSVEFVKKLKDISITSNSTLVSFDVTALFTSIPTKEATEVIRERLVQDSNLKDRTKMNINQIIELLSFCLDTTYFIFNGVYYKQAHGAAMGSPVSPIVANIYMEAFEQRAITSAPHPPSVWLRYVDDTFVIIDQNHITEFHEHVNNIDPYIKFTIEKEENNQLPFLDIKIHRENNGSLSTTIYRKPTHTNQYLNFNSNHHLQHKRSVVRTLIHRANHAITNETDKKEEIKYIKDILSANDYKKWMINIPPKKQSTQQTNSNNNGQNQPARSPLKVTIPYIRGFSEKFQYVFKRHNIPQTI